MSAVYKDKKSYGTFYDGSRKSIICRRNLIYIYVSSIYTYIHVCVVCVCVFQIISIKMTYVKSCVLTRAAKSLSRSNHITMQIALIRRVNVQQIALPSISVGCTTIRYEYALASTRYMSQFNLTTIIIQKHVLLYVSKHTKKIISEKNWSIYVLFPDRKNFLFSYIFFYNIIPCIFLRKSILNLYIYKGVRISNPLIICIEICFYIQCVYFSWNYNSIRIV